MCSSSDHTLAGCGHYGVGITHYYCNHYYDTGVICGSARCGAHFGQGTGSIVLNNVNCTGSEPSMFGYDHNYDVNDCGHHNDAGVVCTGEPFRGRYCKGYL